MRKLLFIMLVLIAGVIGVGFWRGWFGFSTSRDPETGQRGVQFKVDPGKVKSDVQHVRDKVTGSGGQAKEQPGGK